MPETARRLTPYELFALLLSIFALVLVAARAGMPLDPDSRRIIDAADLVVCAFFFVDFISNLVRAPNRIRYLYTWGWLDLIASIPAIDAFRIGRIGRVVRILRVVRVVKASRLLALALLSR